MISRPLVAGFVFLALAGVARADGVGTMNSTVGKVQGTYARLARGVFVETKVMPASAHRIAETWLDVRLDGGDADARDRVLAQAPAGHRIETGDLVEVRIAPDGGRAAALPARRVAVMPEKSQVTGVRAKYDTAEAMDFAALPSSAVHDRTVATLSSR